MIDWEQIQGDLLATYPGLDPEKFKRLPYKTTLSLLRQIPRQRRNQNYQMAELSAMILNALGAKRPSKRDRQTENASASTAWRARDMLLWSRADIDQLLELGEPPKLDFDLRALRQILTAHAEGRITGAAFMRVEPYLIAMIATVEGA